MKKNIVLIILISFAFMQGKIGGYAIFDYKGSTQQFDVDRAYLIYTKDVSDDLFFKFRLDVGRDTDDAVDENGDPVIGDSKLSAYLKNVYVDWKCKEFGKFSIGLISTNSFGVQEKNWGYRFLSKSPIDRYGMTKTADFGVGYSKSFGKFDINLQVVNGEGYKADFDSKNTNDDKPAAYLRLMYGEKKLNKNDGFNAGLVYTSKYYDYDDNDPATVNDYDDNVIGLFAGWAGYNCRLGIEYNQQDIARDIETASSLYFNYNINDKIDLFLRHDMNDENIDDEFEGYDQNDELIGGLDMASHTMLGMVWNPTKGLYLAPNVIIAQAGDDTDAVNEYRLTFMLKY
tara:strand:- start:2636 stop:3664 length:1029 start_codon:yes stop_codon:yes gene_type:complete